MIESYLSDESGVEGQATGIAFPKSIEELQETVKKAAEKKEKITIQSGRTGFCGGAVPQDSFIINMSKMNHAGEIIFDAEKRTGEITVGAGFTLANLNTIIDTYNRKAPIKLQFYPNPSETEATLGGIAATAACGSAIGPGIKGAVKSIVLVDARGGIQSIKNNSSSSLCSSPYSSLSTSFSSSPLRGEARWGADVIIGSEGTLGIIAELTLLLTAAPPCTYGLFAFFDTYQNALQFYTEYKHYLSTNTAILLNVADWFDLSCNDRVAGFPQFPENTALALWLEIAGEEDVLLDSLETAMTLLDKTIPTLADKTLAATEETDLKRLKTFRHQLTEDANQKQMKTIDYVITKDFLVKNEDILQQLRASAPPRELFFMGHLETNILNIRYNQDSLPLSFKDNPVSHEHGIGQAKRSLFLQNNPEEAAMWTALKKVVDSDGLLNPGVLI
ncbi:MAG: FAD-binding oxidoreductase [Spirochaetaceae bacterium]|jgi:FAD/FMN-containing dehydrogenase|nr:FAD-binding oxidoreductase [Spirochaetaceae bacterium]